MQQLSGSPDGVLFDKDKDAVGKAIDEMNGTRWELRNGEIIQVKKD